MNFLSSPTASSLTGREVQKERRGHIIKTTGDGIAGGVRKRGRRGAVRR